MSGISREPLKKSKMNKYRIKQIGSSYYPQTRRLLLLWCNFVTDNGDALSYPTLESAKDFLTVNHVQIKMSDKVVIHQFNMWGNK